MKTTTIMAGSALFALLVAAPVHSAQHDFLFETFYYPGAALTQAWSTNNKGEVAANTESGSFYYASRSGGYVDIDAPAGFSSISTFVVTEAGEVLATGIEDASGDTVGLIIGKQGAVTVLRHPDASDFTQPRGMSSNGIVAGFYRSQTQQVQGIPALVGFTYDRQSQQYSDFVPSIRTIAQGVNSDGEVVGDALFFPEDNPCNDSAISLESYSFLRSPDGAVSYFQINDEGAAARAISNQGSIAGYTRVASPRGFLVERPSENCTSITVAPDALISVPDAQATFLQFISESGKVLSGNQINQDGDSGGFIATR